MDCKEELLIFAKTGNIFAKCDEEYHEKEGTYIRKYLEANFPNSLKDIDVEEEIEEFVNKYSNSELFDQLVFETKEYIKTINYDNKKEDLVKELDKYIYKIIKSDKKIKPEETMLYYKWQEEIYKSIKKGLPPTPLYYKIKNVCIGSIIGIIVIIAGIIGYRIISNQNNKAELEAFPLSSYTEKMLQFKEIDFSKVLIYGTETDSQERDSLLLYFVKGTAVLRFRDLDNLSVNSKASTKDTLVLDYNMNNQTELPINVEIIYDESKCRFIDSIEATTLKNSSMGKTIKGISTVAGTVGGGYVGNAIGGLFGLEGQVIGLASGAVLGGVGGYIASANFVNKTKIVKDNSSSTIRDLLEEAKPVIAAQLLQDETVTQNTDKNELDLKSISKYYRQQLADILTNIMCNDENNKWKNIEIRFISVGKKN